TFGGLEALRERIDRLVANLTLRPRARKPRERPPRETASDPAGSEATAGAEGAAVAGSDTTAASDDAGAAGADIAAGTGGIAAVGQPDQSQPQPEAGQPSAA